MILKEQDIERALNQDYQNIINELVESADLMLKGNRMLVENQLSEQEYQVLQEGLWEKVKYGLSKLGRYKAGGKIFGKKEIDQASAAKIQSILDKKGNEMIKNLDATIKKQNPKFPNNEKGEDFLNTVIAIAELYDSIVASTKKKVGEEGYLQTSAANSLIVDLAEYVKKFLDVDLAAAYTVMDSEEEKVDGKNDEKLLTDEVGGINEDDKEKPNAADIRAKLQAKGGNKKYDTIRMGKEGLGSNKLPLILAGVGGSLGALGWLAQTDWLKSLIESWLNKPGTEGSDAIYKTISGGKPDAEGFIHWAHQIDPSNPMKTGADVTNFVNKFGAENVSHMFDGNGAGDSMDQIGKLQQLVGGDNASKGVGELFKSETFGDMKGGRNLFGISKAASFVGKILVKQAVKAVAGSTAGTVLAGKIAAIGSVLAPIGITLFATGALVKLMRMKGKKQSRAKTLNDLLQSLQPVPDDEATTPAVIKQKPNPVESGEGGGESSGKANKETLFNDLAGFFKFTYNNRKMASPEIFGDKKESADPCSKLEVGMEVLYKPLKDEKEDVFIVKSLTDLPKGKVKLQRKGNIGSKGSGTVVDCSKVKPIKKGEGGKQLEIPFEESINRYIKNILMENKNLILISEGKFIKDPEVIKMLKEKSGIDANKLKFFEGFLTRLEIIRNKVRKMDNTGDKVMDKFIQKLKANPIMKTNFENTFNVSAKKPERVKKMGAFINSFIEVIYKGNFRGTTFKEAGGMVNKMGKLGSIGDEKHSIKKTGEKFTGGGNINKVSTSPMGESYLIEAETENKGIKQNSIQFIVDVMGLFQYMYKLKKEGKLSSGKKIDKSKEQKSGEVKKMGGEKKEVKQESIQKPENKFLKEEVKRILTLMNKI